jgi:hypothetical protein
MKTRKQIIQNVSVFMLRVSCALVTLSAAACVAQEISNEDVQAVEARVSELESLGVTVPQEAPAAEPQTYMSGAILAVDSSVGIVGGVSAQWALVLADGVERIEIHLIQMEGENGFSVFNIRQTDGQWLLEDGQSAAPTFAVEIGNVSKFVDASQARLGVDIKMAEALQSGQEPEIDAKSTQRLAPGAFDVKTDGVSVFVVEGDLIVLTNEGPAISNVFWAPMMVDDATNSEQESSEGESELAGGPSPAQQAAQVCGRLFQLCMTHEDDIGLRACIAWLQYCAPRSSEQPVPAP